MPVLLKCDNCDKIDDGEGIGWLREPIFGGTRVLCPKCLVADEDYQTEAEIMLLIETAVSKARREAEGKYTPEYVKQLRAERAKKFVLLIKPKPDALI